MKVEKMKQLNVFTVNAVSEINEHKVNDESDYIEETIGAMGLWQVMISIIAALTRYTALGNMTSIIFLTPVTNFICTEFEDNITLDAQNNTCYKSCMNYVYHSEVMETTLISDYGLICERAWLGSFTQTVTMFGVVFGTAIFGWISDRLGRRVALISSSILSIITMIPASFVPYYWFFNALRFVTGVACGGTLITSVTIILEITGKKYRELVGGLCFLPDGISETTLPLYAYFLPKWNTYLLGFSIACTTFLTLACFIPESPRWLISNGKIDRAVDVLTRAAKFNKLKTTHIRDTIVKSVEGMKVKENKKITANYLDFFRTKYITIITAVSLVLWTVIGTTYFGINQYMTLLDVNVFTTVVLLGLIQVPTCFLEVVVTKTVSRKLSVTATFLVTGIAMIILIFIPKGHWITTLIGVIGLAASSGGFIILYIYAAELFPTTLRTMAFGMLSSAAKAGAMVAPFIANVKPMWIPSTVFGVLSFIAAITCYVLPETKGNDLEDVID